MPWGRRSDPTSVLSFRTYPCASLSVAMVVTFSELGYFFVCLFVLYLGSPFSYSPFFCYFIPLALRKAFQAVSVEVNKFYAFGSGGEGTDKGG